MQEDARLLPVEEYLHVRVECLQAFRIVGNALFRGPQCASGMCFLETDQVTGPCNEFEFLFRQGRSSSVPEGDARE